VVIAFVTVLHLVACVFLILVVLLQTGKGAEMGAVFGGGGSSTLFGASGAGNFLTKLTTGTAIVFFLTSLFLAYSSIPVDQRGGIGSPRGKYKGWLGSLEPRAEDAGDLTADALIERGWKEKAFGPDGKLHMLAIAGDRSTPSSIKRNQGMRRAIAENPRVVLDQEVYAAWTREKALEQADWLYQRYPHARLIWAGNDLMAFGAMAAWEKRGGKPGADAWFSGINTSTEALEAIKSGRLTSLAGGHFITGAWTLVMIYDYHHGRDFAEEGLELERPMFAEFTPPLADRYIQRFSNGFDSIDFSRYSKVKNPQLKRYNFGFAQLLEAKP